MNPLHRASSIGTALLVMATALPAQQRPKLSTVLTTFLADSGVRTRGLPWTTGSTLPVRWQTARPVANQDQSMAGQGLGQIRAGALRASVGGVANVPMTIMLYGNPNGLQRVAITFDIIPAGLTNEMVEQALTADGITLRPLKCDRTKEGASYGNLVSVMTAPGKASSALWFSWNARHDGTDLTLTILYRRADLGQVECAS